jgi:uncharacterized membrane protein YjjP (DUF1212 family)
MQKYLSWAMNIGEQMLINGAEVHRVEDSVKRICKAFGFERTDVFIITSSMVVSAMAGENTLTQTRRIKSIGTDFEKLHRLNSLSRKICEEKTSLEEIKLEYDDILKQKNYPFGIECLAYAVISGAFTLFFEGTFYDSMLAFAIGALIYGLIYLADRARMNRIFIKLICCFFATVLALFALKNEWINSIDKDLIGNIMTMIPGIGLTNAIRDLFTGDSIAGLLRLIEAVLTALALAAGYFAAIFLFGGVAI